ncbi:MAG: hypothetical protein IK134_04220 [Oscillospiraceae bacterium]|nr:hypothetical protein [Oscillospiraceae bacterium]
MSQKLLITLAAAITLVILIAGISSLTHKHNTSSEESSEIVSGTEMIIVPSEMPERISLEVPAGFTETNSQYYEKYYVCNDASVIVTGEDLTIYGQDVKTYSEDVKAQYQNTADDFLLLSEEDTAVDGVDCRLFEFTYAIKGDGVSQEMQCMTAVIIKDERVYIVTCKSHRDTFMNYRQPFRKMLESIRIADEVFPSAGTAAAVQTDASAVTSVS